MCEGQGDTESAGTDVKHGAVSNVSDPGIHLELPHSRLPNMSPQPRHLTQFAITAAERVLMWKRPVIYGRLRPIISTQVYRRVEDVLFLQPQGICLKCNFSVGLCS